jgi:hypothetical protein
MDQRSIVFYFARKEFSAIAIHYDLVARLGPEVVSYSSMTHDLREAILVPSGSPANIPEAKPQFNDCTRPFSSRSPNRRLR